METFTFDPRTWRIARMFGRNPLLRCTDRVEALVVLVALVASLLAVPLAGVVGVATYGAHDRLYAQQARERHLTKATVAEAHVEESGLTAVQARWPIPAGKHTGKLRLPEPVKAGERIAIWVDKDGNPAPPPTPAWHAVGAAAGAVLLTLLIAGAVVASLSAVVMHQLDRVRDARWERDLRCLVDDGGRTNRQ